jgi:Spy/CpxP family protein refolding chaperone
MTFKACTLAVALALALPLHAAAQSAAPPPAGDLGAVRAALAADKRAYVAGELGLTPVEANRFWPIYENYQRQIDTTNRRNARLVEEVVALDRPLTDAHAKRLAQEYVAIRDEEAKDRRRVHNQLMRALPPTKALRYLQIESKAHALRQYDIAGAIPLVK